MTTISASGCLAVRLITTSPILTQRPTTRSGRFSASRCAGYKIGQGLLYGAGGYEYMISDPCSVGTEVLCHEFDSVNTSGTHIEVTTLRVRAIYRF